MILTESARVGVFVHGRRLRSWERRCVDELRRAGVTCEYIVAAGGQAPPSAGATDYVGRLLDVDLPPAAIAAAGEEQARAVVLDEGRTGEIELAPQQIAELRGQGYVFILHFGACGIPKGLAAAATLGVWRYTNASGAAADHSFIRGLYRRDDVVRFALEQIASGQSRPRRLTGGYFRARGQTNRAVVTQVLSEASRWPLQVLKQVEINGDLGRCQEELPLDDEPIRPATLVLSLVMRDATLRLVNALASYFLLETWNIGFVRMSADALVAGEPLGTVALLPRPRLGHYVADPFVLATSPELKLLVEDYNDFRGGRISELTVRDPFGTPVVGVKVCLENGHHLSYPFVFREDGVTYCLPECHQSNASLLYRHDSGKLVPVAELLRGARATDGTLLFHDGLYWLFCGLEDDNDHANLHLFFSESLRGPWSAHPLNPVKTDVRSSRSAGAIIERDGKLFRPAQDCSKSYGYGLSLNRIDCLSRTRFSETVVANIRPESISARCKGIHTLSIAGDLMVIDAKFQLVGAAPLLVRLLRRLKRANISLTRAMAALSPSG